MWYVTMIGYILSVKTNICRCDNCCLLLPLVGVMGRDSFMFVRVLIINQRAGAMAWGAILTVKQIDD